MISHTRSRSAPGQLDKTEDFRKLAMGRLLDDLQSKMHRKAALSIRDPLKIAINSCHDTSLAGIMSTLDVFDNR